MHREETGDLELVHRVLAGDARAGAEYSRRMLCVPRILAVQNRRLGRPLGVHDLEDLSQEVLTLIWTKLPEFEGAAALETWAYRFCYLQLMNAVRSVSRSRSARKELEEDPPSPEMEVTDRFSELYRGIARLPRAERAVIEQRLTDVTFEEIARRTNEPATTIKSRYYAALSRLSSLLTRSRSRRVERGAHD